MAPFSSHWRRGRDDRRRFASPLSRRAPPASARTPVVDSNAGSNWLTNSQRGRGRPIVSRFWRRGRDSNPRYGVTVNLLSKQAPSTARPPLRKLSDYPAGDSLTRSRGHVNYRPPRRFQGRRLYRSHPAVAIAQSTSRMRSLSISQPRVPPLVSAICLSTER
jgi:hypothetical protein